MRIAEKGDLNCAREIAWTGVFTWSKDSKVAFIVMKMKRKLCRIVSACLASNVLYSFDFTCARRVT